MTRKIKSIFIPMTTVPSARLAAKIEEFETSADHEDPTRRGFILTEEQRAICKWFGDALDVAFDEERQGVPLHARKQSACLLIGAAGTGKSAIILQIVLPIFLEYFPAEDNEERYAIITFSRAQRDAISNETFRAKTAHAAVGMRVASLRNQHMALNTKRAQCERTWNSKIFVVQDEVSLFPAMVQNMLLYRSMRSRQNKHGLQPDMYGDVDHLMGRVPILLIAGDFLQIKPAKEISIADDLDALEEAGKKIHPEHHTAQDAILGISDVIQLTKSKRFLDEAMSAVMQAVRRSRPNSPLAEEDLQKLRERKIENCQSELITPLFADGHIVNTGTIYAAQGLTFDGGVLVDMRNPVRRLSDDQWWLAVYVMLSRARRLTNLILIGFTEELEDLLRRGPPTRLVEVTEMLEQRAQSTLARYS